MNWSEVQYAASRFDHDVSKIPEPKKIEKEIKNLNLERKKLEDQMKAAKAARETALEVAMVGQLQKLELKPGNVLIVQLHKNVPPDQLHDFVKQLRDLVVKDDRVLRVPIFLIPPTITVSTLSEKEMNAEGWFRREDYRRLLRPKL